MKYSSLFTQPPQTPINRAFPRVKSRLNSSPLFTQVSKPVPSLPERNLNHFRSSSQMTRFCTILHAIYFFKVPLWVKSGEELRELFTSPNALFIGVCEGWVKSEEYYPSAKFAAFSF